MFPQLQIRREGAKIKTKIKNHAAIIYVTKHSDKHNIICISMCRIKYKWENGEILCGLIIWINIVE